MSYTCQPTACLWCSSSTSACSCSPWPPAVSSVSASASLTRILLLLCGYAGGGLLGFAVFWAYLIDTDLGRGFALAVTAGWAIVLLDACRGGFSRMARVRDFRAGISAPYIYAATGLFNLALGYLHGGFNAAMVVFRELAE